MSLLTGLFVLAVGSLVLWLLLVGLAVARKLRRDRREALSSSRRAAYGAVLAAADGCNVAALLAGITSTDAEIDLAVALAAVWEDPSGRVRDTFDPALQRSELGAHLRDAVRSRRPTRRGRAALLLSYTTGAAAETLLIPLLADPDIDVRLVTCAGLARIGTRRTAEALIWGLHLHLLPAERVIERLGAPWAVDAILLALDRGLHPLGLPGATVTVEALGPATEASLASAIGLAGERRAAASLRVLLERTSIEVRISAARALGRIGGSDCVGPLIAALHCEDWPVRAQAAKALGALGSEEAIESLEHSLTDRAWWVRTNAARALIQIGDRGIEVLQRALAHDDRYAVDRAREELALHALAPGCR